MVIGITGTYCSGKSFLSQVFIEMGFEHIEVDSIGHDALIEKHSEIHAVFGDGVLIASQEPTIDRKTLGKIAFTHPEKLAALERIVHPWMTERVKTMICDPIKKYVISAALLHKMHLDVLCDVVILVETGIVRKIIRAKTRDLLSYKEILKRFAMQKIFVPTKKTIKQSGKTTEIVTIRGVYSRNRYKKIFRRFF